MALILLVQRVSHDSCFKVTFPCSVYIRSTIGVMCCIMRPRRRNRIVWAVESSDTPGPCLDNAGGRGETSASKLQKFWMNTSTPTLAIRTRARKQKKNSPASVTLQCHRYAVLLVLYYTGCEKLWRILNWFVIIRKTRHNFIVHLHLSYLAFNHCPKNNIKVGPVIKCFILRPVIMWQ